MREKGLVVRRVEPGSIAEELGLTPGDRIMAINEYPVEDLIDYRFLISDETLSVEVKKFNDEVWVLDLEKDYDQDLGVDFGEDGFGRTRRCSNKCIFCFVDQMAPGMRKTLYVKDDDYRLSFWSGNFITLTNVDEDELRRIARLRLSPLYISVHTTNPALRERMLGSDRAGLIKEQLEYLAAAGIEMHTQVVLCPGINDGSELVKTVDDLARLWPWVRSLAVAPVGLTRFRQGKYVLRPFTSGEARTLVNWVQEKQAGFQSSFDYPFLFASDEFYLLAGEPFPQEERYADFPQTENGVGLARLFQDQWDDVSEKLPEQIKICRITLATGILGERILRPVVVRLNQINGLSASLKVIENNYFGPEVTVAGLITGKDLLEQISPGEAGDMLILPSVMFKSDEAVMLDGLTLEELSERLKTTVAVVKGPKQLVDVLMDSPDKASCHSPAARGC